MIFVDTELLHKQQGYCMDILHLWDGWFTAINNCYSSSF